MIRLHAMPCGPGGLERADEILPFRSQSFHYGDYGHEGLPSDYDMDGLILLWEIETGSDRPKETPIGFWILEEAEMARILKQEGLTEKDEGMSEEEARKEVDALSLRLRAAFAKAAIAVAGDAPRP